MVYHGLDMALAGGLPRATAAMVARLIAMGTLGSVLSAPGGGSAMTRMTGHCSGGRRRNWRPICSKP
jgi:hypothetical protein